MGIIFNAWRSWCAAKTQVSLTRFLQSEVKIIHIIVQNNTKNIIIIIIIIIIIDEQR